MFCYTQQGYEHLPTITSTIKISYRLDLDKKFSYRNHQEDSSLMSFLKLPSYMAKRDKLGQPHL
jgi:hypothetical protein